MATYSLEPAKLPSSVESGAGVASHPSEALAVAKTPKTATRAKPSVATAVKPLKAKMAPAKPRKQVVASAPASEPEPAQTGTSKERVRLVRDSFTLPEADYALIAALKARALGSQRHAKKSELLRAGLRVLAGLDAKTLVQTLDRLEPVKTGRPRKGHGAQA